MICRWYGVSRQCGPSLLSGISAQMGERLMLVEAGCRHDTMMSKVQGQTMTIRTHTPEVVLRLTFERGLSCWVRRVTVSRTASVISRLGSLTTGADFGTVAGIFAVFEDFGGGGGGIWCCWRGFGSVKGSEADLWRWCWRDGEEIAAIADGGQLTLALSHAKFVRCSFIRTGPSLPPMQCSCSSLGTV